MILCSQLESLCKDPSLEALWLCAVYQKYVLKTDSSFVWLNSQVKDSAINKTT